MNPSVIHDHSLLYSTSRLNDASRLLEVLLFIAERFRRGSRQRCECVLDRTRDQSNEEGSGDEYCRGIENDESGLLYQKAHKTTEESQKSELDEIFQIIGYTESQRRLEMDPPLALVMRPGANIRRRRNKDKVDIIKNGSSQATIPSFINNTSFQHVSSCTATQFPINFNNQSMSSSVQPNRDQFNNEPKNLHVNVKLSNLSALIETLEQGSPLQWITHHGQQTDSYDENIVHVPTVSRCSRTFNVSPVVNPMSQDSHVVGLMSQFPSSHGGITEHAWRSNNEISLNHRPSYISESSDFSDCHSFPAREDQLIDQDKSGVPNQSSPSLLHWDSLLAACLLCIQLWKYLHSVILSDVPSFPFHSGINCIDIISSSIDRDDFQEWIQQLDMLTWRLEFLAQQIYKELQSSSFIVSSLRASSKNSLDGNPFVVDDFPGWDSSHNNIVVDNYRSIVDGFCINDSKASSNSSTINDLSIPTSIPTLNRFQSTRKSQLQPNYATTIFTLKSCRLSPRSNSLLRSTRVTIDPLPLRKSISEVHCDVDSMNEGNTEFTDGLDFHTRFNYHQSKRMTTTTEINQDFPKPGLNCGQLGSMSLKRGNQEKFENSEHVVTSAVYDDDGVSYIDSQMYLSRMTVPRLVPIWDDALKAEVEQSRYEELAQIQRALHDLQELQESVAQKTIEEGERLEQTEQVLGHTDAETRDANVELAKANKARSSWWGIKASGAGTIGGAAALGLILGPVGAVAGGSLAGVAGLIAGNSLRRTHDAKMDRIISENKQNRSARRDPHATKPKSPRHNDYSLHSQQSSNQTPNIGNTPIDNSTIDRSMRVHYPKRMPFI